MSTANHASLALDDELAALMETYADRAHATESPPLRVRVDRDRARFGAWYEMFPRSAAADPQRSGTFRDRGRRLAAHRRSRLRRRSTCRRFIRSARSFRKGRTTARRSSRATRQPVGDRVRRRRPHSDRTRTRHARRFRSRSGQKPSASGSRSRSTSPGSARRIIRGCASILSGSATGRTARSSTRRIRRRNTRTSTRSTSSATSGAALWRALLDVTQFWIAHGVTHLPRRQPAHEDVRLLGVADRAGPRASIPTSSSWRRRSRGRS